jgi:hypothetical protein
MTGGRKAERAATDELVRIDRNVARHRALLVVVAGMAAVATLLLPGCSNSANIHAVDMPRARDALKTALDHWKRGESPKSLESATAPMIVQDFDWAAGVKLIDYQLIDNGKAEDANLRAHVKLTMSGTRNQGNGPGTTAEKTVWYLVTTSPKITVFRDMLKR